jgi:hypothetical protein
MSDATHNAMPAQLMRYRKLRIAWSVVWGIACVLLIVLWVRNYEVSISKEILVTPDYRFYLVSVQGTLAIERWYREFVGSELTPIFLKADLTRLATNGGIYVRRSSTGTIDSVSISFWLLFLGDTVIASVPWIRWRFSLRTLLIATTLVAVVLGLIVWLHKE